MLTQVFIPIFLFSFLLFPLIELVFSNVIELILRFWEAELRKMREKTREMEEQLRADRSAMVAKENERLMLMRERDHKLAEIKAVHKLVSEFLEAGDNNNFHAQKAMKNQIIAFMTGGMNGENIGELDNAQSQNQYEQTGMATIVGKDGDSE
ncbi:hypothetical protein V6N13_148120 [Hibiscus sabdariffa]|uniref:Uncharacterized protein n=1 Tax=Hibiscus sabdariffa TaxID=183260 RepID=A0ABR2TY29_9ROSI